MVRKFTPAEKMGIVFEYLSEKHRRGAVKDLCKRHGVSRALVGQWLDLLHRRAYVACAEVDFEARVELEEENRRLRRQNARLWARLHEHGECGLLS